MQSIYQVTIESVGTRQNAVEGSYLRSLVQVHAGLGYSAQCVLKLGLQVPILPGNLLKQLREKERDLLKQLRERERETSSNN